MPDTPSDRAITIGSVLTPAAANDAPPGPTDMTLSFTRMATITIPPGAGDTGDWKSLTSGTRFPVQVDGGNADFEIFEVIEVARAFDGRIVIRAIEVLEKE